MASLCKVILIGNVGKDPVIRHTKSGEPVASFGLATSEKWTNKAGGTEEKVSWHNVEVFGKLAVIVRDYVTKGKQLYVEGTIDYQHWQLQGQEKSATKIKVTGFGGKLILLGSKSEAVAQADGDPGESSEEVPF